MAAEVDLAGWSWFEAAGAPVGEVVEDELCRAFARCFAGADGELACRHLARVFLNRRLPPSASDAELRHLEGQRSAIAHIDALIARGRT